MSKYDSVNGITYPSMTAAEPTLLALRKSNPDADLMVSMTRSGRGYVYAIIERPNHLKGPSEFDGMTLSQFIGNCSVSIA